MRCTQREIPKTKYMRDARNKLLKNKLIAFLCIWHGTVRVLAMCFWAFCRNFVFFFSCRLHELASKYLLCTISCDDHCPNKCQTQNATRHHDQDVCLISTVMIIKFLMCAHCCWKGDGQRRRQRSLWSHTMKRNVETHSNCGIAFFVLLCLFVVSLPTLSVLLIIIVQAENDRYLCSVGVLPTIISRNLYKIVALGCDRCCASTKCKIKNILCTNGTISFY